MQYCILELWDGFVVVLNYVEISAARLAACTFKSVFQHLRSNDNGCFFEVLSLIQLR